MPLIQHKNRLVIELTFRMSVPQVIFPPLTFLSLSDQASVKEGT